MNNIAAIEEQIVAVLQTVTELRAVYDHEPLEVSDLPAASIFYAGFSCEDLTVKSQQTSENWVLRLYVRLQDAELAQDEMKVLIPKVREAIRQNPSLNNTCLYNELKRGDVFAVVDANNPQLVAELHLSAITEEAV